MGLHGDNGKENGNYHIMWRALCTPTDSQQRFQTCILQPALTPNTQIPGPFAHMTVSRCFLYHQEDSRKFQVPHLKTSISSSVPRSNHEREQGPFNLNCCFGREVITGFMQFEEGNEGVEVSQPLASFKDS